MAGYSAPCRGLAAALLIAARPPAALDRLENALAAENSATAALRQWCAARGLARDPAITAAVIRDSPAPPPPPELARLLGLGPDERPGYRHVRLSCGGTVLSEARNWYVPARLTPAMNQALGHGDTPFGAVAAPLRFTRQRLGSRRGPAPGCPAATVLAQRALLRLPGGRALAYVVECYTPATLER